MADEDDRPLSRSGFTVTRRWLGRTATGAASYRAAIGRSRVRRIEHGQNLVVAEMIRCPGISQETSRQVIDLQIESTSCFTRPTAVLRQSRAVLETTDHEDVGLGRSFFMFAPLVRAGSLAASAVHQKPVTSDQNARGVWGVWSREHNSGSRAGQETHPAYGDAFALSPFPFRGRSDCVETV